MPSKPPPLFSSRLHERRSYAPTYPSAPRGVLYAPSRSYHRPSRWRRRALIVLGVVTVLAAAGWFGWRQLSLTTDLQGIDVGAPLRPDVAAGRPIAWTIEPASAAVGATVTLDGAPVPDVAIADGTVSWVLPAGLVEGTHTLALTAERPVIIGRTTRTWTFTIDATPPSLAAVTPPPVPSDSPVSIDGTVEPSATVVADGQPVAVTDGTFRVDHATAPLVPVHVVATDAAGNSTALDVAVDVLRPPVHGIHVRAEDWGNPEVRAQVEGLIAAGAIDAVQLDIKDERGVVGYDSAVALAREIGAVQPSYDVQATLADLAARDIRVIGRIVAFRDPILAQAVWQRGHRDGVLQDPAGGPLAAYGGFTNYVDPTVREYNLALAVEAAQLGFDDILWDYVRRPEGSPSTMVVPGLGDGVSSTHIVSFLAEAKARLAPLGVRQGASVFGIAATRGDSIGQDIPEMAKVLDYLAPMLYPSHWNDGEYGVADPNGDPYAIIKASLDDFRTVTAGTRAGLVPWLQDFDDGSEYGAEQVQAQVRATQELDVDGFLLWNPSSRYSPDALAPLPG